MAKVDAARGYGATVVLGGEGFDDAVAAASAHVEETGATFVHAFDDPRVVAGQGTLGLELAEQLPAGPGTVVIPIGGGGLAAGVAIGLRALRPELSLIGVQAAACAPFAGRAPDRADDRGRDRRQVPGRAHLGDPSRSPRRGGRRRGRGDLAGDRPPARAVEARGRGRRSRPRRSRARRARSGRRAGLRRARRRQHRRDDADVGDALRPHLVRPLSRRPRS